MVKFLAPLALASAVLASPAVYDPKWTAYKEKFNKNYTPEEDLTRYNIYLKTMEEINAHNARANQNLETFFQGETTHTDMTHDEVNKKNGWGKHKKTKGAPALGVQQYPCAAWTPGSETLPTNVDWVSEGVVTVVKNQLYCGDCWAFSAAACMEGSWAMATGDLISLSAQQLTDCTSDGSMGAYTTDGCNGGFSQNAFAYDIAVGGIESWTSYPFADMQTDCAYPSSEFPSVASFNGCYDISTGDESLLEDGIAQLGPVSVAIDAGLSSFHNYVSGVYYAPTCSSTELDHAVTATGFGVVPAANSAISATCTEQDFECEILAEDSKFTYPCISAPNGQFAPTQGKPAWKVTQNIPGVDCNAPSAWAGQEFYMVKNSWGLEWGMNGYIMMARNQDNNCGIATAPSYVVANAQ